MSRLELALAISWALIILFCLGLTEYSMQPSDDLTKQARSHASPRVLGGGSVAVDAPKNGPPGRDLLPDGPGPLPGTLIGRLGTGEGVHPPLNSVGRADVGHARSREPAASPRTHRRGNANGHKNSRASGSRASWDSRSSGLGRMGSLGATSSNIGSPSPLPSAMGTNPSQESWRYQSAVNGGDLSTSSGNWDRDAAYQQRAQKVRSASESSYGYEGYYCRTAREIREVCDSGARNHDRHEFCLSFAGYYTNSRHCGYHP